ncbi:MAG: hypothetical protein HC887_10790 [Desulfobacteraceae bacterium]|nr:hypothetical protein [Desulfobacteraceae bacterium]
MRLKYVLTVIAFALCIAGMSDTSVSQAKTQETQMIPQSFTQLADTASPAVVNIRTEKKPKDPMGRQFRQFGQSPFGKEDPFNDFLTNFRRSGRRKRKTEKSGIGLYH